MGADSDEVACPSPSASTFLMIAAERASLLWLKQQPTQHNYYLQKLISYLLENWQISSPYCFILLITVSIAKENFLWTFVHNPCPLMREGFSKHRGRTCCQCRKQLIMPYEHHLTLLVCRRWPSGSVEFWYANIYLGSFSLFVCVCVCLLCFVCFVSFCLFLFLLCSIVCVYCYHILLYLEASSIQVIILTGIQLHLLSTTTEKSKSDHISSICN